MGCKINSNMLNAPREYCCHFEVRITAYENCYSKGRIMHSGMDSSKIPADVEKEQKFDRDIVRELVKVLEVLQNLED